MKLLTLSLLGALLQACSHTAEIERGSMHEQRVALWYEAFSRNDPALVEEILSADWVDIPPAPGQPKGPDGVKFIMAQLTAAFPDLRVTIRDILQDGDKVVVRSEITGTQRGPFLGIPGGERTLAIMAIDIHEFEGDRIARTWHTEDWMTGLQQLGVIEAHR